MGTVLEKLLTSCENAVLNGKPILFLRTNEIELVRRVINSDRLVVRLSKDRSKGVDMTEILPTRDLHRNVPLQLFTAKRDTDNFNIHYITKEQLPTFSDTTEVNYGIPTVSISANEPIFPSLFVVCAQNDDDFWKKAEIHAFLDRYLQEWMTGSAISSSVLLIYGEQAIVPQEYQAYCEIIDEPYPEVQEIRQYLADSGFFDREAHEKTIHAIADAMLGFSLLQMERTVQSLSIRSVKPNGAGGMLLLDERRVKKAIQLQKEQILKKTDLLELIKRDDEASSKNDAVKNAMLSVGGMGAFKTWLEKQKNCIKEGDLLKREAGVYPPKGVLLCGIPGCGKSMAVECVADVLDIPLLKMDIGRLMGQYVGESEHNMIKALKLVEAMSPCILFIDELDKGFDAAKKGKQDSGPFTRMFGTLLSWIQDCKKPCFIFATANDISGLPKEFFRSGRFDCLFSLYMPTAEECVDIFQKRMLAAEKNCTIFAEECYDKDNLDLLMMTLAKEKRFVTGADIAKLVQMALRELWRKGGLSQTPISWKIWEKYLLSALHETTVYGDSKESVDSIVFCYLRLLRSNFISASDVPLFDAKDYHVKRKICEDTSAKLPEFEIEIAQSSRKLCEYDQKMRELLVPLLKEYGALVERCALEDMLR